MLLKLVASLPADEFQVQVVSLSGEGPMANAFRAAAVRLDCIGSPLGRYDPLRLVRLAFLLRAFKPQIVQGWMYHGNTARHSLSFGPAFEPGSCGMCAAPTRLVKTFAYLDALTISCRHFFPPALFGLLTIRARAPSSMS